MNAETIVKLADFNARELGLKWTVTKSRDIRLKKDNREYCPIEVAGNFEELDTACRDMQLHWLKQNVIICAADDLSMGEEPDESKRLRQLMMQTFEFEVVNASR